MKQTNIQEKIDDYLFGKMSAADQQKFELDLKTDSELASVFKLQQLEHKAMQIGLQDDLRNKMNQWRKEKMLTDAPISPSKSSPLVFSLLSFSKLKIAAAIVFLLALGGWLFIQSTYSNRVLSRDLNFAIAFKGKPNDSRVAKAVNSLQEKNYLQTLLILDENESQDYQIQLLRAEAYLGLKNYPQAIKSLKIGLQYANAREDQKVEWILILVYLASGDTSSAKYLLKALAANPNHEYTREAHQILKKLNSFWHSLTV